MIVNNHGVLHTTLVKIEKCDLKPPNDHKHSLSYFCEIESCNANDLIKYIVSRGAFETVMIFSRTAASSWAACMIAATAGARPSSRREGHAGPARRSAERSLAKSSQRLFRLADSQTQPINFVGVIKSRLGFIS